MQNDDITANNSPMVKRIKLAHSFSGSGNATLLNSSVLKSKEWIILGSPKRVDNSWITFSKPIYYPSTKNVFVIRKRDP